MLKSNTQSTFEELIAYQKENTDTDIYFSLSTCVRLLTNKEPKDIFVMSFGKNKPHLKSVHKHIPITVDNFISFQPFKLDTLLISLKDSSVIDVFKAQEDIQKGLITTVKEPSVALNNKPFLIIRAASLIAETGFSLSDTLMKECADRVEGLKYVDSKLILRELKRLLRADTPSKGIEFLRSIGALRIILPELDSCYGVDQNKKYHKYSVYEHCLLACDRCDSSDVLLRFAALIHDVGKAVTKGENENGITFHKHEVAGSSMASTITKRLGMRKKEANYVVSLVSSHMYQYDKVWKDSTVLKFIAKTGINSSYLGRLDDFPLFKLRQADRMGRDLEPITQKQKDFQERIEKLLSN